MNAGDGQSQGERSKESAAPQSPRRGLRLPAIALLALVLIAGAFVAGNVSGDDSDEVSKLRDEVAKLDGNLADAEDELDFVEEELDLTSEQKANLASQLKAERDLSGELDEFTEGMGSAPDADYVANAAGTVGEFVMRPSLERGATSEDETTWLATIEVKNNGSSPAEIFCGSSGATLIDSTNRTYEGESVLAEDTANCGSSLQPGLTADNYVLEFTLPSDAKPAVIEISGGEYGEGPTKSWAVESG